MLRYSEASALIRSHQILRAVPQAACHSSFCDPIASTIRVAVSTAAKPSSAGTSGVRLRPDRVHERIQLRAQRLDVVDLQLLDAHQVREVELRQVLDLARADLRDRVADRVEVFRLARDHAVLLLVIDRHVRVGAEDAELPLGLHRQPRRGDVRDAAVLERQPGVADVLRRRRSR